jgi:hypothetical protein
MEGHRLRKLEWVGSAMGSGFVSRCDCGFESHPWDERAGAIAEISTHIVRDFAQPRRPRWLRDRTPVLDLRDRVTAR